MINYSEDFSNKVVIITGAGSGIGKETAKRMIDNGAKVALWDYNEDTLNNIQKELGQNSLSVLVDVSDENSVNKAANEVRNPRQSSSPQRISDNAAIHALKVPGFIPIL